MLINIDWFLVKSLKQGIKNRNSVLNRVGKSAIFVLNRVRVWGAAPHLPTQRYIEYPPGGGANKYSKNQCSTKGMNCDYIYVSAVDPLKPNISEATLLKYYLFNDRGGGMKEEVFNPHVLI